MFSSIYESLNFQTRGKEINEKVGLYTLDENKNYIIDMNIFINECGDDVIIIEINDLVKKLFNKVTADFNVLLGYMKQMVTITEDDSTTKEIPRFTVSKIPDINFVYIKDLLMNNDKETDMDDYFIFAAMTLKSKELSHFIFLDNIKKLEFCDTDCILMSNKK